MTFPNHIHKLMIEGEIWTLHCKNRAYCRSGIHFYPHFSLLFFFIFFNLKDWAPVICQEISYFLINIKTYEKKTIYWRDVPKPSFYVALDTKAGFYCICCLTKEITLPEKPVVYVWNRAYTSHLHSAQSSFFLFLIQNAEL